MNEKIKKAIKEADKPTLTDWWCVLNAWKWPSKLGVEPSGLAERTLDYVVELRDIMAAIKKRAGHQNCMDAWRESEYSGDR